MVDIHNHSLFGVDDGAETIETSIAMLQTAYQQGVDTVILTPHYRHGMFAYPTAVIKENYRQLSDKAEQIGVKIYLGCEYHVNSRIIEYLQNGRCLSLAGGNYVLTEYDYESEYSEIYNQSKHLLMAGYIPVIAHVERYQCIQKKPGLCQELSEVGAWIQINAGSVLGKDGRNEARCCKKLLQHEWVDVIASDAHGTNKRPNYLRECRSYVEKKCGTDLAGILFEENPRRILKQL
ncbi:MAG: CpsB/CapC family capsule biosynthesis tyrosine phosphatase [Roseburia sp.]